MISTLSSNPDTQAGWLRPNDRGRNLFMLRLLFCMKLLGICELFMQGAASSQEGARHRRTSVMTDVVVRDYVGSATAERLMDTASTLMPNTEHDDAVQASGALQTQQGPVHGGGCSATAVAGGVSSFGYAGTIGHAMLRHVKPTATITEAPRVRSSLHRRAFTWHEAANPFAQRPLPSSDGHDRVPFPCRGCASRECGRSRGP